MRKYRPSNGTEGGLFIEAWCFKCKKDKKKIGNCRILARTLAFDINDKRYPKEWRYGKDRKPECVAFKEFSHV